MIYSVSAASLFVYDSRRRSTISPPKPIPACDTFSFPPFARSRVLQRRVNKRFGDVDFPAAGCNARRSLPVCLYLYLHRVVHACIRLAWEVWSYNRSACLEREAPRRSLDVKERNRTLTRGSVLSLVVELLGREEGSFPVRAASAIRDLSEGEAWWLKPSLAKPVLRRNRRCGHDSPDEEDRV